MEHAVGSIRLPGRAIDLQGNAMLVTAQHCGIVDLDLWRSQPDARSIGTSHGDEIDILEEDHRICRSICHVLAHGVARGLDGRARCTRWLVPQNKVCCSGPSFITTCR